MIIVNTGEGKGKTTAALGLVMRNLGQDGRVAVGQYLKRDDAAGEQAFLKQTLGEAFLPGGLGFYRNEKDFPRHREAAQRVTAWALDKLGAAQPPTLLVLDEALYALGSGLLMREELEKVLALAGVVAGKEAPPPHVVLTGRGLPQWLEDRADLVTEMVNRKHPASLGLPAQHGVEM